MTVGDIQKEMEALGWTKDSVQSNPPIYWQLVELAQHFYSLGFNQSISEVMDASEDFISTMT